jgi:hypothetical protein
VYRLAVKARERSNLLSSTQLIDRFAVFEDTCRAAGLDSGLERLRAFLTLPEQVQGEVFADLALRLKRPGAEAEPESRT